MKEIVSVLTVICLLVVGIASLIIGFSNPGFTQTQILIKTIEDVPVFILFGIIFGITYFILTFVEEKKKDKKC